MREHGATISKPPTGTKGARKPPRMLRAIITFWRMRMHRRNGDRFRGMDLLYLTTAGARSGMHRMVPVARFADGRGGWIIVASGNGSAAHPAWYHNLTANPDQVWVTVEGHRYHVLVNQLDADAREEAWHRVVEHAPAFNDYLVKTDRRLPVLRLTPRRMNRLR